jgi:hypothetical protein
MFDLASQMGGSIYATHNPSTYGILFDGMQFDYIKINLKGDPLTQKGIAARCKIEWLVVSSVAPIRNLSYKIFVVQYVISWLGLIVAVFFHVPAKNQIWVCLPLGF